MYLNYFALVMIYGSYTICRFLLGVVKEVYELEARILHLSLFLFAVLFHLVDNKIIISPLICLWYVCFVLTFGNIRV